MLPTYVISMKTLDGAGREGTVQFTCVWPRLALTVPVSVSVLLILPTFALELQQQNWLAQVPALPCQFPFHSAAPSLLSMSLPSSLQMQPRATERLSSQSGGRGDAGRACHWVHQVKQQQQHHHHHHNNNNNNRVSSVV